MEATQDWRTRVTDNREHLKRIMTAANPIFEHRRPPVAVTTIQNPDSGYQVADMAWWPPAGAPETRRTYFPMWPLLPWQREVLVQAFRLMDRTESNPFDPSSWFGGVAVPDLVDVRYQLEKFLHEHDPEAFPAYEPAKVKAPEVSPWAYTVMEEN